MAVPKFPWDRFAEIGFGVLRLSPRIFWASSPRELTLAVQAKQQALGTAMPLERQRMVELMANFPDGDKYESG
jgi:uncharacterized phage protein (TIGR02216 family)